MMWWGWVAIGAAVLALVIFTLVALGTLRRLPPLRVALAAAADRPEVATLMARLPDLRRDLDDLRERVAVTQERTALLKRSNMR